MFDPKMEVIEGEINLGGYKSNRAKVVKTN
jgi:hypothetical protein